MSSKVIKNDAVKSICRNIFTNANEPAKFDCKDGEKQLSKLVTLFIRIFMDTNVDWDEILESLASLSDSYSENLIKSYLEQSIN
jgi:hypothetical protein